MNTITGSTSQSPATAAQRLRPSSERAVVGGDPRDTVCRDARPERASSPASCAAAPNNGGLRRLGAALGIAAAVACGSVHAMAAAPYASDAVASQPTGGLATIPESWVPKGQWDATVDSELGTNDATVTRTDRDLKIVLHGLISFDVDIADMNGQKADLQVHKPWPMPDLEEQGMLTQVAPDHLHMDDQRSNRSVDFYHQPDGTMHIQMHKPGDTDDNVYLRRKKPPALAERECAMTRTAFVTQ